MSSRTDELELGSRAQSTMPHTVGHVLSACILIALVFSFARHTQVGSFDFVQHFLLIDEIMKHGGVRPGAYTTLQALAFYPPAAHWAAAVIGWVGGSGLAGMMIVTVASVYLSYLLIVRLIGADLPINIGLFAIAFLAFRLSGAMIGWEIVGNFFYPQIVGDVVYFGLLLFISTRLSDWHQVGAFLIVGLLVMWIQPLIAVHILAAGCVLMLVRLLGASEKKRAAVLLVCISLAAAVIVMTNPAFRVMRAIAANNGDLNFNIGHLNIIAIICAAIGFINLRRWWSRKADYVDAVLGSAVVASALLELMQFAVFVFHGDGSPYAVKKHFFLVLTLGIMNATRVLGAVLGSGKRTWCRPEFVTPVMAGLFSCVVFAGYTVPLAPIISALSYANQAVRFGLPGYIPGNTVDIDASLPLPYRLIVTQTAFQHPFDNQISQWLAGGDPLKGAKYAMVARTPELDEQCRNAFAVSETYMIVEPACLSAYTLGQRLIFKEHGNGLRYQGKGWSAPEPWGAWATGLAGGEVLLDLPGTAAGPLKIAVQANAFLDATKHRSQKVVILANGKQIGIWSFDAASPAGLRSAEIPAEVVTDHKLTISFLFPDAVSPSQVIPGSGDTRVLGLGISSLVVERVQ